MSAGRGNFIFVRSCAPAFPSRIARSIRSFRARSLWGNTCTKQESEAAHEKGDMHENVTWYGPIGSMRSPSFITCSPADWAAPEKEPERA